MSQPPYMAPGTLSELHKNLELGPNCPPEDVAPECRLCPEYDECDYANTPQSERTTP